MKKDATRRIAYLSVFLFLTLVPLGMAGYKLYVLNYPLAGLVPAVSYHVDLSMQMDGHGEDISTTTYLPRSDARQIISDEQNSSGLFAMAIQSEGENRIAAWKAENVRGQHSIIYSFQVQAGHVRYRIPERLEIPRSYPAEFAEHLAATEGIQVNDPLIEQELRRIIPERNPTLLSALTRIHRRLQDNFRNKDFSGYTDAVTALKLGEASCNGKSRLFAALVRKLNIPARLVGGLILKQGTKRVTHQWVEVYVNGHWVPLRHHQRPFRRDPVQFPYPLLRRPRALQAHGERELPVLLQDASPPCSPARGHGSAQLFAPEHIQRVQDL